MSAEKGILVQPAQGIELQQTAKRWPMPWRGSTNSKIEKTVSYLGNDVEDPLALAENTEI